MSRRAAVTRRGFARTIALCAALALASGVSAPAIASLTAVPDAAVPDAAEEGAVVEADGIVVAGITGFGPAVMTSTDTLRVNVLVENATLETAEDVELSVAMTAAPLETRQELADFLDDPATAETVTVVERLVGTETEAWTEEDEDGDEEEFETVMLPPGASASESVPVRVASSPLADYADTSGVFGLAITLEHGDAHTVVDTLVFTWADAAISTVPVSIVATASGTPTRVAALLTAASHPSVAIVVDPGHVPPDIGADIDLRSREVYRLPTFNPDVTSLAHAEDEVLLDFALERSATDAPPFLQGAPWLGLAATLDESTLNLLHEAGAVAALVDPRFGAASLDLEVEDGTTAPPVANVRRASSSDHAPLIVPDAGLSDLLATFRTGHPGTPSRLVAEVALIAANNPDGAPVVISPGPSWVVDGTQASPSIEALFSAPFVEPMSLSSVLSHPGRPSVTVPELTATDTDLPAADVQALSERLELLTTLAETVEDPRGLIDRFSARIFSVVALDARFASEDRSESAAVLIESLDDTLGAVSITSGSALNLVAAAGDVPITVRNGLDVDSTVRVVMDSRAPELNITEAPLVTIPANSTATVGVPVTAVSSANVTVAVTLETESGHVISPVQQLDIRVRADWGNAVTAVFTGGLVLLLIAGLVRTVRRGRKDTRTGPGETSALEEPSHPGNAHE